MSLNFQSEADPSEEACRCLEETAPTNPFQTGPYLDAMRRQGYQCWILSVRQEDRLIGGCYASMKSGWVNRQLQIDSIPSFDHTEEHDAFWSGLAVFCAEHQVSFLRINSFGSSSALIPPFEHEVQRTGRYEFVLVLENSDLWSLLSSNHKRNIRRALKSGVAVRKASTEGACRQHADLMNQSMERRSNRGEAVAAEEDIGPCVALVQGMVGEIYQAIHADTVISSILVLKSGQGAYYHSAGTSPEGMSLGASHLLIHECCKYLQEQRLEVFNLGGSAERGSGLARFKSGFGSEAVELESAEVFVGGTFKKTLNRLIQAFGR